MTGARPDVLLVEDPLAEMPIAELLGVEFNLHVLRAGQSWRNLAPEVAGRVRALSTSTLVGADADLIATLPALEIIACAGTHVDRIDREAARARGVPITNTPHLSTGDVADLAFGLLLAAARRIAHGDRFVRAGHWTSGPERLGARVAGRRLGVVGLGRIGLEVARRAQGFAMPVAYTGPAAKDVPYRFVPDLRTLAAGSDYLVVTCRSEPATRHLVNAAVLEALGADGILVNVSRGVVDDSALVAAIADERIRGAGLDVFEAEPHVPEALKASASVVLTPHVGSATAATRRAMAEGVLANLKAHFSGRPLCNPA